MKSLVAAFAFAASIAFIAPPAGANLLSPSDQKLYHDAFVAASKGDFSRATKMTAGAHSKLLGKVVRWLEFTKPNADVTFAEISNFIRENPGWPQMTTLQKRAEEAITLATPAEMLLPWFQDFPPLTADGKTAYGQALIAKGRVEQGVAMLREAWVKGSFGVLQERQFITRFGDHMRHEDHVARLDRLLWDKQEEAAQRMILRVDMPHRLLAQARLALINGAPGVEGAVDRVTGNLANDPGLVYDRVRWRRQKDLDEAAIDLLSHPAANKVRPELWWVERQVLARRALQRGHISKAYEVARNHGLSDGSTMSDAEWFAGWIALRYLSEEAVALQHFKKVHDNAVTQGGRARGAYWAGRAADALKDSRSAQGWYEVAGRHVTGFYGQLAANRLSKDHQWPLPADPLPSAEDINDFERRDLTRVVRMLGEIRMGEHIGPFILRLNETAKSAGQRALAANLATSHGRQDLAVMVARRADRDGVAMIASGYPVPPLEVHTPEKALVLALIRQESGFQHGAVSSVGARGLMQLMPATAKQVAKTLKVSFSPDRLADPAYNVRLGTTYLADMIDNFNGSYVLSLVAYNAGPGRARSWIREFGDPRNPEVDPIDWIENIPFTETRHYVQRVLESVQVYRRRLGATDFVRSLDRDLRR